MNEEKSTAKAVLFLEATPRFELGNQGFADPCLTTWLCRLIIFSRVIGLKKDA